MEKIKNLSLRWKFGVVVLFALFLVIFILFLALRGYLNREFEALYGDQSTKGKFVAALLADELEALDDIDREEAQQAVDAYRVAYGVYGVSYIFVLNDEKEVILDTLKGRVSQTLIDINPLAEDTPCESFNSGERKYHDCFAPLRLPDNARGSLRIGVLEQNPDSPVWQSLKNSHVKGVANSVLLISVLLIIIVTVGLTLAFWFLVVRRIVSISQATERMSFGDLETVVEVKSQDEIGILEDTLERMRANLKDAIERLKRRK